MLLNLIFEKKIEFLFEKNILSRYDILQVLILLSQVDKVFCLSRKFNIFIVYHKIFNELDNFKVVLPACIQHTHGVITEMAYDQDDLEEYKQLGKKNFFPIGHFPKPRAVVVLTI